MKKYINEIYSLLGNDNNENQEELNQSIRKFAFFLETRSGVEHIINDVEKKDDEESEFYYFNDFLTYEEPKKGKKSRFCGLLYSQEFCLFNQKTLITLPLNEMIGIHPLSKKRPEIFGLFLCCICVKTKKFHKFTIETKNLEEERKLVLTLQQKSFLGSSIPIDENFEGIDNKKRRILVIINPTSGSKKSVPIFNKIVKPILEVSHLTYESIITEREGHATEIIKSFNPQEFNSILSIGGDGSFFEILQGLMTHLSIPYHQLKKIPLSIIPTGTGNGLSISVGSSLNPYLASLITIRGRTVPYNIISYITPKRTIYSSLFFTYGVGCEIDLGYESIKWMGDFKYVIAGLISMINRPLYGIDIQYVQEVFEEGEVVQGPGDPFQFPKSFKNVYNNTKKDDKTKEEEEEEKKKKKEEEEEEEGEESEEIKESTSSEEEGDEESEEESEEEKDSSSVVIELNGKESDEEEESEEEKQEEEIIIKEQQSEEEEEEEELHDNNNRRKTIVKTIKEPTFYLQFCNARKNSKDFWGAAKASPGNGTLDMLWCHKIGFFDAVISIAKMMMSEDFTDRQSMNVERVKAFYFVPKGPRFGSCLDIDGEEFPIDSVLGCVHKGLISVCHLEVPFKL